MKVSGTVMIVLSIAMANLIALVNAHGRMIEPPNRASLWRLGYEAGTNYNDNALNCGGFQVQWLINGGRCGHCGDPYSGPREHESGGKYASDVITRTYRSGEVIDITIDITANHGGYFRFFLCLKPRLSENCFNDHQLLVVGEGYEHKLRSPKSPLMEHLQLQLPEGVSCKHCVLQWRWNCGQSYGMDFQTGAYCKGCGAQEQFWNCADITIEPSGIVHGPLGIDFNHKQEFRPKLLQDKPGHETLHTPSVKMPQFSLYQEQRPVVCRGSTTYGILLDDWCKVNCDVGFCPPSHCTCS